LFWNSSLSHDDDDDDDDDIRYLHKQLVCFFSSWPYNSQPCKVRNTHTIIISYTLSVWLLIDWLISRRLKFAFYYYKTNNDKNYTYRNQKHKQVKIKIDTFLNSKNHIVIRHKLRRFLVSHSLNYHDKTILHDDDGRESQLSTLIELHTYPHKIQTSFFS